MNYTISVFRFFVASPPGRKTGVVVRKVSETLSLTQTLPKERALTRLGGFEGVERRKCLKINARIF
jgi:hypothetical protein